MADSEASDSDDFAVGAKSRPVRVTTPLSTPLAVKSFKGTEGLSEPFRFELSLMAESDNVDFAKLLGGSVTVTVDLPGQSTRVWNGIVTSLSQTGQDDNFTYYEAVLEPALVRLRMRNDFRIFQDKKIDDIVDAMLTDLKPEKSYLHADSRQPHNFRVQYGESDLNFVSRLMEEAGLFYYFKHAEGSHTLVLCDDSTKLPAIPDISPLEYRTLEGGVCNTPAVKSWIKTQRLTTSHVECLDPHFQLPRAPYDANRDASAMASDIPATIQVGKVTHAFPPDKKALPIFQFPGGYAARYDSVGTKEQDPDPAEFEQSPIKNVVPDGKSEASLQSDLLAMAALRIDAQSNALALSPGGVFTLGEHFNADADFLVTRVAHQALVGGGAFSREQASLDYSNEFNCQPSGLPYRSPRRSGKPVVNGVQSAMVVADVTANEADPTKLKSQLYDKYGRVKVWFPWDRRPEAPAEGEPPAGSVGPTGRSCWVRVSQFWAGAGWGAFFWPRHGHEVLVAFEYGDPDRPVIVGSVYNAKNLPPMKMPVQQAITGVTSCSIQGNPKNEFNGVTFHDDINNEHLSLHSEAHRLDINEQSEHSYVYGSSVSMCGSLFGSPK
ncbi:Phage-related baseplate assembly protein [Botrimarina colliarenosi]|uniref:Phage-related baseplate assembly protein n=1 Tax=Botrimarina colliarenosi TaxID=2528001 RepID=A0A5C6AEP1_9BACT|nr:type VI secretion system tip protein TssI/VgrG [Botrimarina colliarenosi]TWT97788.1 Phage-related baseplate assembly protein [Botrimarina colliarenosi]